MPANGAPNPRPTISTALFRGFAWYGRRFVRRNFHALRISGTLPVASDRPLIVYLNHASWWDPMICLVLAMHLAPDRNHYAPIDASMLEKYRFFKKLGFFGVEPGTARGARQFLRTTSAICNDFNSALWITAEGRFTDVRTRPVVLQRGLSHLLAHGCKNPIVVPLAIEYAFWEERYPEVLCRFGPTIAPDATHAMLEDAMSQTQDALAGDVIARDASRFTSILGGSVGVGGIYDLWRRLKAVACGREFDAAHGSRPHA